ncbi:MAG: hypothetical protein AAF467_27400 [Actinomycetota bacterium]
MTRHSVRIARVASFVAANVVAGLGVVYLDADGRVLVLTFLGVVITVAVGLTAEAVDFLDAFRAAANAQAQQRRLDALERRTKPVIVRVVGTDRWKRGADGKVRIHIPQDEHGRDPPFVAIAQVTSPPTHLQPVQIPDVTVMVNGAVFISHNMEWVCENPETELEVHIK